ncbi:MAG: MarR family winged helix-turn-helix transcriptional regulator [Terracidiphilus sp.]
MKQPTKTESRAETDARRLPLPTLLSHALVAFTIEFDNEFEHRMPHSTTRARGAGRFAGPWLVSMVMYSNLMRLVSDEGVSVRELTRLSRTPMLQLNGMERWGYITVAPDPRDTRPKPPQNDWMVRPTEKGRRAQTVWQPLFGEIEQRWRDRFGSAAIERLCDSLSALVAALNLDLPEYLPVLGYGLYAEVLDDAKQAPAPGLSAVDGLTLPALLSKVLLAFTLEFERESEVSLAICANLLRVLGDEPVRVRDLPRLSGVSKEAIGMATGFLRARKYAVIEPDSTSARGKVVRLTAKGKLARENYLRLRDGIEERWQAQFGAAALRELRQSLEAIVGDAANAESPLLRGLEPYAEGWRASVARPATLPHYPMVLHRGGYPDGS